MVILKKKRYIELLNRVSFLEEELKMVKTALATTNTNNSSIAMKREDKRKETIINEWLYGKEQRNGK